MPSPNIQTQPPYPLPRPSQSMHDVPAIPSSSPSSQLPSPGTGGNRPRTVGASLLVFLPVTLQCLPPLSRVSVVVPQFQPRLHHRPCSSTSRPPLGPPLEILLLPPRRRNPLRHHLTWELTVSHQEAMALSSQFLSLRTISLPLQHLTSGHLTWTWKMIRNRNLRIL